MIRWRYSPAESSGETWRLGFECTAIAIRLVQTKPFKMAFQLNIIPAGTLVNIYLVLQENVSTLAHEVVKMYRIALYLHLLWKHWQYFCFKQ